MAANTKKVRGKSPESSGTAGRKHAMAAPEISQVDVQKDISAQSTILPNTQAFHHKLPALDTLRLPVKSLPGITLQAATVLENIGIQTVYDLAVSGIFSAAEKITIAGRPITSQRQEKTTPIIATGLISEGARSKPVETLSTESISILTDIGKKNAAEIEAALGAYTVADLAEWPMYLSARDILDQATKSGGDIGDEDPESPADLIPGTGMYPTERVQYDVIVLDSFINTQTPDPVSDAEKSAADFRTASEAAATNAAVAREAAAGAARDLQTAVDALAIAEAALALKNSLKDALSDGPINLSAEEPSVEDANVVDARLKLTEAQKAAEAAREKARASAQIAANASSDAAEASVIAANVRARAAASGPIEDRFTPVDISLTPFTGFSSPAIGAVLTYTQAWYAEGLALGHLLHSVALSPGETTRVAIIDWNRRDKASSTESTNQVESLSASMERNRAINEITDAVANESQTGFAHSVNKEGTLSGGSGTGAAGTYGGGAYNFSGVAGASVGGSYGTSDSTSFATSGGNRKLHAEMSQNIRDCTQQAANSVRNRRASVVREVSQSESECISTRAVTNFNHMHALTVQYYEVVQIFKTVINLAKVTRCLFIPMRVLNFFDSRITRRYRCVLARAAQSPELRATLLGSSSVSISGGQGDDPQWLDDARAATGLRLIDSTPARWVLPSGTNLRGWKLTLTNAPGTGQLSSVISDITFLRRDGSYLKGALDGLRGTYTTGPGWRVSDLTCTAILDGELLSNCRGIRITSSDRESINDSSNTASLATAAEVAKAQAADAARASAELDRAVESARAIANKASDDLSSISPGEIATSIFTVGASKGGEYLAAEAAKRALSEAEAKATAARAVADASAVAANIAISKAAASTAASLNSDSQGRYANTPIYLVIELELMIDGKMAYFKHQQAIPSRSSTFDVIEIRLSEFLEWGEAIDQLQGQALYFSQAIWKEMSGPELLSLLNGYTYKNKSLAESVDPTPVAVLGNYLAFKYYGNDDTEWCKFLEKHPGIDLRKESSTWSDYVPVPSGGVFAEAVLGRSNSAEKLDITRFWNWQDSPIPVTAPEISPLQSKNPSTIQPDLTSAPMAQPVISVMNAPGLPDPTALSAALSAIANGSMFRDMSNAAETIAAAKAALAGGFAAAGQSQQIAENYAQQAAQLLQGSAGGKSSLTSTSPSASAVPSNISGYGAKYNAAEKLDKEQGKNAGTVGNSKGNSQGKDVTNSSAETPSRRDQVLGTADQIASIGPIPDGVQSSKSILDPKVSDKDKLLKILELFGDASLSNSTDINSIFSSLTSSNTYIGWLRSRRAQLQITRGMVTIGVKRFNFRFDAASEASFKSMWDGIPLMFGKDGINLLEFLALDLATHIEGHGDYKIVSEGDDEHTPLNYFFDSIPSVRKRSYNTSPNKSAGKLFSDNIFNDAHSKLLPAKILGWNPSDESWNGNSYALTGAPASISSPDTLYIQQADFYKFRGRGYIQTTNRSNYANLMRSISTNLDCVPGPMWGLVEFWGDVANDDDLLDQRLTQSRTSEWDNLFQMTDCFVAHLGINNFSECNQRCINIDPTLDALTKSSSGTVAFLGNKINTYGASLSEAVKKIMLEMYASLC